MQKNWVFRQPDKQKVSALAQSLNITENLSAILVSRGIETYESAREFFNPKLENLHDPWLMKDMEKAVKRIDQAISNGEKIMLYGDYDVDGTTAVAFLYLFLRDMHDTLTCYIPDRYKEGYGVSEQGIQEAQRQGVKLIITLDCGIRAVQKVHLANSLEMDVIVCDHHLPGETLPEAVAILDPKQPGCDYPYKELSGCGIGFKLAQGIASHFNIPAENYLCYLDLVALSIASDIVPITGENRILAYHGLKKINDDPLPGIKAILETAGLGRKITINELVFWIGPRVNAAGRIGHAKNALNLFITTNPEVREKLAKLLNDQNNIRKSLDSEITEEALKMVAEETDAHQRYSTVVYHPDWHKGVIGIVASRLIENYHRPTIVLCKSGNMLSGSARSVKGFDMHDAIQACSEYLEQFGGHKYAAGLVLKPENFENFKTAFERIVSERSEGLALIPEIAIDTEIEIGEITNSLLNSLNRMAPFGPGNMKPVFASLNVTDSGYAKIVGEHHLKMRIMQNGSYSINAIAFGASAQLSDVRNRSFSVCYYVEENVWQGKKSLQLNVKGIKQDAEI